MICFFAFSDLHHGEVENDGRRVAELTARARELRPDFMISLGDLCPPEELDCGKSCMVFSHHSLINDFPGRGVCGQAGVRERFRGRDVLLCMNGNDHGDDFRVAEGVPYYLVNSASYMWYESIVRYKNALSVCVEIDGRELRILGMESGYITETPEDEKLGERIWNGVGIEPRTSSYTIKRQKTGKE